MAWLGPSARSKEQRLIIELESTIDAPVEQVWVRVVSPEGIDDEMRPWMTMSIPRGAESMTVGTVAVGKPIGRWANCRR